MFQRFVRKVPCKFIWRSTIQNYIHHDWRKKRKPRKNPKRFYIVTNAITLQPNPETWKCTSTTGMMNVQKGSGNTAATFVRSSSNSSPPCTNTYQYMSESASIGVLNAKHHLRSNVIYEFTSMVCIWGRDHTNVTSAIRLIWCQMIWKSISCEDIKHQHSVLMMARGKVLHSEEFNKKYEFRIVIYE